MLETTKICPTLTLPTTDGLSVNVPVSLIREVSTYKCRSSLLTTENQAIPLACTAVQVKVLWVDILLDLAQMGCNFSQRDYDVLPLLSETEDKVMLTTALDGNLTYHEYAHQENLRQWANEDRLRFLEILKERKSDVLQGV